MSKWLGYTVELFSNGQWFNIDQWHRHANGELRHRYLYTAPERDIFSSAHDELALSKERICFSDLAAETQDIICAENPAFERSTFDSWDFFIWGNLSDLEMLLQKPVENENDGYISKDLLKGLLVRIQDQIHICKSFFSKVLKLLAFQGVWMFLYSQFPLFFPLSGKNKGKSYCTLSSSFAASRLASLLACA